MSAQDLEQRALELLAAGYERERCPKSAAAVRNNDAVQVDTDIALRTIVAALRQQPAPVDLEQFREAVLAFMQKASNGMSLHANPASEFERECYESAAADFDEAQRLLSIIDNAGKPCPCGEPTCTESWEPGCGLGSSKEHARVGTPAPHQPAPVVDDARMARALEWVRAECGFYNNAEARTHLLAIEEAIAAYDPNCGARTVRVVDDAMVRDAERYRWLRDKALDVAECWERGGQREPWCVIGNCADDASPCYGQELDAAIDTARAQGVQS